MNETSTIRPKFVQNTLHCVYGAHPINTNKQSAIWKLHLTANKLQIQIKNK